MVVDMGLFSKKPKEQTWHEASATHAIQISDVPVGQIVDVDTFVDSTHQGKETTFRIVRFTEEYSKGHHRSAFGTTHEAVVVRGAGKKEYVAMLGIANRVVVKSYVDKFYG